MSKNVPESPIGNTVSSPVSATSVALRELALRPNLDLASLRSLLEHPTHGQTLAPVTLGELASAVMKELRAVEPGPEPTFEASSSSAPCCENTPAESITVSSGRRKSAKRDIGGSVGRLGLDGGKDKVMATLRDMQKPALRNEIEKATGFTGVQTRKICKSLISDGKISTVGQKRALRYYITGSLDESELSAHINPPLARAISKEIMAAVKASSSGITLDEIVKCTGLSSTQVGKTCTKLLSSDKLSQKGEMMYIPSEDVS